MGIIAAYALPHPPLIIPEVGGGREKEIESTIRAYDEAARRIGSHRPETIVLISPHQILYEDYFHISPGASAQGDFGRFGAGKVKVRASYDEEFVQRLCALCGRREPSRPRGLPAGTLGEREKRLDHGTMIPLYFVNRYWEGYRLVRVGLSGLPLGEHYELGRRIRETAQELGRRTVVVASGDLSHRLKEDGPYGFREEGPKYDRRVMDVLGRGAFGELLDFSEEFCERAGECGHRSFVVMAGALDGTDVLAERLSYEGPFGVGYGICAYEVRREKEDRRFLKRFLEEQARRLEEQRAGEDAYVRLARMTVEAYTRTGKKPPLPEGLEEELEERRAGVFVSLKKDGRLRGCIGTIRPVCTSVAEEIMENAVSACSRDPRFSPVEPWELAHLSVSVDVLGDTERIASPAELDAKRYGVIVTKGQRRGLLLPNLEGVDTVEEQIAIAKRKAGIGEAEEVSLERFEVVRHR